MKPFWPAVLLFLLGACDRPIDPASQNESGTGAQAQVAAPKQLAKANSYPAGYIEMKTAAAIFAKESFGEFSTSVGTYDNSGIEREYYLIEDCQAPFENAEMDNSGDPKQLVLENLAREIAKHEHYLSQQYTPAVYQEPLRDYEMRRIEHIAKMPPDPKSGDMESPEYRQFNNWSMDEWVLKQQLADAIEKRRQRLEPNKTPVNVGGGCGAGEQAYLVKTEPSDGRVWITTKFSFDLCRARKRDPWETESCRWTEVSPTESAYLAGRYVYQAKWRDGTQRRGVRSFDGFMDPEKEGATEVVIKAT